MVNASLNAPALPPQPYRHRPAMVIKASRNLLRRNTRCDEPHVAYRKAGSVRHCRNNAAWQNGGPFRDRRLLTPGAPSSLAGALRFLVIARRRCRAVIVHGLRR